MGGVKSFSLRRLQAVGRHIAVTPNAGRMVTLPTAKSLLGNLSPGRSTIAGGGGTILAPPGFEPPTIKTLVSYITIWPLLAVSQLFSPPPPLEIATPLSKLQ